MKRLKSDTTIIYPNLSQRSCKTDLFKETVCRLAHQSEPQHPIEINQVHQEQEEIITDHQRRTLQDCKSWDDCREDLILAHFESQFPSCNETCAYCNSGIEIEDHIRCSDCSLQTFFCSTECLKVNHNGRQLVFHKPQIWKVLHI